MKTKLMLVLGSIWSAFWAIPFAFTYSDMRIGNEIVGFFGAMLCLGLGVLTVTAYLRGRNKQVQVPATT